VIALAATTRPLGCRNGLAISCDAGLGEPGSISRNNWMELIKVEEETIVMTRVIVSLIAVKICIAYSVEKRCRELNLHKGMEVS
jgi:hypothetical protein